jgi:CHAT domain-containing protein
LALALLLAWTSTGVRASDQPAELAQVVAAGRAKDEARLRRLARAPGLDPWAAVDGLAREGLAGAAPVYAQAVRQADADALRRYAKDLPAERPDLRRALGKAVQLVQRNPAATSDLLAPLDTGAPSIPSYQRAYLLSRSQQRLGRLEEALASGREAAAIARRLGWLWAQGQSERQVCWILLHEKRFREALEVLGRSRRAFAVLGSPGDLAVANRQEAGAYLSLAIPGRAVPLLRSALRTFKAHGPPDQEGTTHAHMAQAQRQLGNFAAALDEAEKAEACARRTKQPGDLQYATYQRSAILLDMGKAAQANELGEALLMQGGLGDDMTASVLANLGMGYVLLGRYRDAAARYATALARCRERHLPALEGWILMMRGWTLRTRQGAWKQVVEDGGAARRLLPPGTHDAAYAEYVLAVGNAGLEAWTEARAHLEAARRLADDLDLVDLQCFVGIRSAQVDLGQGHPRRAIAASRRALAALDLSAAGLADEEAITVRTQEEHAQLFATWQRAAFRLGDPALEFEALEAERARTLLMAMGGSLRARGIGLPAALRRREEEAQRELLAAREHYLYVAHRSDRRDATWKQARARLEAARRGFVDVSSEVQRQSGARAALAYPAPADLDAARAALPEDVAVALYAADGDEGYVLLVRHDQARTVRVKEWSKVRAAARRIAAEDLDDAHRFRADAALLDARLLAALALPASVRTLYVCPCGELMGVPWRGLGVLQGSRPDVWLVPSAATLALLRKLPPVPGHRVLGVGAPDYERKVGGIVLPWAPGRRPLDPLPRAADEVRGATRDGDVRLLGPEASETRAKAELSGDAAFDLVLFSCHGVVDAENPSLTSLVLSPTSEDDGFLTATDVFGLRVRANLVVLSACDLGQAQAARGAGALGLVRAFMAAGAPRVLASLWPAADTATSVLVDEFVRRRRAGETCSAALRHAQQLVRDTRDEAGRKRWDSPYYWAGWVLWGARP